MFYAKSPCSCTYISGYLIMAAILTLVGILLAFLIVIPIKNGESNFVLDALFTLW